MRVSLIVCTRNRAARLPEFLARVASLEAPPGGWELIVVDNASTDSTPHLLDRFARDAPFPVRCVHAADPGLSRARNTGLAHARGDILAFTDDDCCPQPDFLRALVDAFNEDGPGFVGGRVVLHDPGDARICVGIAGGHRVLPRSFVPAGVIHGANMAVTRDVVRAVGEFDPLLGAGAPCAWRERIPTTLLEPCGPAGAAGTTRGPSLSHHHGRKPGHDAETTTARVRPRPRRLLHETLVNARSRRVYCWVVLGGSTPPPASPARASVAGDHGSRALRPAAVDRLSAPIRQRPTAIGQSAWRQRVTAPGARIRAVLPPSDARSVKRWGRRGQLSWMARGRSLATRTWATVCTRSNIVSVSTTDSTSSSRARNGDGSMLRSPSSINAGSMPIWAMLRPSLRVLKERHEICASGRAWRAASRTSCTQRGRNCSHTCWQSSLVESSVSNCHLLSIAKSRHRRKPRDVAFIPERPD